MSVTVRIPASVASFAFTDVVISASLNLCLIARVSELLHAKANVASRITTDKKKFLTQTSRAWAYAVPEARCKCRAKSSQATAIRLRSTPIPSMSTSTTSPSLMRLV